MTEFENIAHKLRRIGFGVKITGDKLTVWESWEKECLLILGVKTYKEGILKRARQLEDKYGLKLISWKMHEHGISEQRFI